jgi:hypothetical protein
MATWAEKLSCGQNEVSKRALFKTASSKRSPCVLLLDQQKDICYKQDTQMKKKRKRLIVQIDIAEMGDEQYYIHTSSRVI